MFNTLKSGIFDNGFNFSGRASRSEYWKFHIEVLVVFIISVLLLLYSNADESLYIITFLIFTVPGLAVSVRRLHDIGHTGWFIFLCFIPYLDILFLLYMAFAPSDPGKNEYGPNPKENGLDAAPAGNSNRPNAQQNGANTSNAAVTRFFSIFKDTADLGGKLEILPPVGNAIYMRSPQMSANLMAKCTKENIIVEILDNKTDKNDLNKTLMLSEIGLALSTSGHIEYDPKEGCTFKISKPLKEFSDDHACRKWIKDVALTMRDKVAA